MRPLKQKDRAVQDPLNDVLEELYKIFPRDQDWVESQQKLLNFMGYSGIENVQPTSLGDKIKTLTDKNGLDTLGFMKSVFSAIVNDSQVNVAFVFQEQYKKCLWISALPSAELKEATPGNFDQIFKEAEKFVKMQEAERVMSLVSSGNFGGLGKDSILALKEQIEVMSDQEAGKAAALLLLEDALKKF